MSANATITGQALFGATASLSVDTYVKLSDTANVGATATFAASITVIPIVPVVIARPWYGQLTEPIWVGELTEPAWIDGGELVRPWLGKTV